MCCAFDSWRAHWRALGLFRRRGILRLPCRRASWGEKTPAFRHESKIFGLSGGEESVTGQGMAVKRQLKVQGEAVTKAAEGQGKAARR